jgi:hypothetical protein
MLTRDHGCAAVSAGRARIASRSPAGTGTHRGMPIYVESLARARRRMRVDRCDVIARPADTRRAVRTHTRTHVSLYTRDDLSSGRARAREGDAG